MEIYRTCEGGERTRGRAAGQWERGGADDTTEHTRVRERKMTETLRHEDEVRQTSSVRNRSEKEGARLRIGIHSNDNEQRRRR